MDHHHLLQKIAFITVVVQQVSNNPDWITITSGNGAVTYSVASNLSVNPRSGQITVAGQTFIVFQLGIAVVGLSKFKTDFDSDGKTDIGFYRTLGFIERGYGDS